MSKDAAAVENMIKFFNKVHATPVNKTLFLTIQTVHAKDVETAYTKLINPKHAMMEILEVGMDAPQPVSKNLTGLVLEYQILMIIVLKTKSVGTEWSQETKHAMMEILKITKDARLTAKESYRTGHAHQVQLHLLLSANIPFAETESSKVWKNVMTETLNEMTDARIVFKNVIGNVRFQEKDALRQNAEMEF